MWVRCRDRDTGHEYDLDDTDARVRRGVVEVLTDYPVNRGREPRPAKHRAALTTKRGGTPSTKQTAEDSAPETKETTDG